jgi:hypothetical protein
MEKDFYLNSNVKKTDARISDIERKNVMNTATQYTIFLLYTTSILAKSCVFVKSTNKSPYSNDDLNFVLDQDELTMVCNH